MDVWFSPNAITAICFRTLTKASFTTIGPAVISLSNFVCLMIARTNASVFNSSFISLAVACAGVTQYEFESFWEVREARRDWLLT